MKKKNHVSHLASVCLFPSLMPSFSSLSASWITSFTEGLVEGILGREVSWRRNWNLPRTVHKTLEALPSLFYAAKLREFAIEHQVSSWKKCIIPVMWQKLHHSDLKSEKPLPEGLCRVIEDLGREEQSRNRKWHVQRPWAKKSHPQIYSTLPSKGLQNR